MDYEVSRVMKLAWSIAHRYYVRHSLKEEMVQEAFLGFLEATRTWDSDKGVIYSYCYPRMRKFAWKHYLGHRAVVPVPQHLEDKFLVTVEHGDRSVRLPNPGATGEKLMEDLDPREREILYRNSVCGDSYADLAKEMGISSQRAHELSKRAAGKARKTIRRAALARR